MAIIKSAKKALRQSIKKRARNLIYINKIKSLVKEARLLIAQKKAKEAKGILSQIYKIFDKAAKVGIIKKNTASRKKSRITKLIAKSQ